MSNFFFITSISWKVIYTKCTQEEYHDSSVIDICCIFMAKNINS